MEQLLKDLGYKKNSDINVWSRDGYAGINYSDGDSIEKKIGLIIKNARDLSVLSLELRNNCVDWPTEYHLSSERANILRPFQSLLSGNVLEIGAGCGAITRYLGETGGNILSLEGTVRRAAIARSRTRDLQNVTVLAEKFEDFSCNYQFDVVTLIGVLEYANLFTKSHHPTLTMLDKIKSMLKPNGVLIIAIENQLGLKYFAGAPEDHISLAMYGIEGRYTKSQAQTFGRHVLKGFLNEAGFFSTSFLAPFPDYKLPVSIVTEKGFSCKNFDAASFAWQSVKNDPQLPVECHFSLELAWPEIFKNNLGLDVSNSFLIAASPSGAGKFPNTPILAYHYSTKRKSQYCKETLFFEDHDRISVQYNSLASNLVEVDESSVIEHIHNSYATYEMGRPLSFDFIRLLKTDMWSFDDLIVLVRRYIRSLKEICEHNCLSLDEKNPYALLPPHLIDAVPQNIIIKPNGSCVLIDVEWQATNIEFGFIVFRSLLQILGSVKSIAISSDATIETRANFIGKVTDAIGLNLTQDDYSRYAVFESQIREEVLGIKVENLSNWWPEQKLYAESELYGLKLVQDQLVATELGLKNAEALAISRLLEIEKRDLALTEIEKIVLLKNDEISFVSSQLRDACKALEDAKNLALSRLDEINTLVENVHALDAGLRQAQSLSEKHLNDVHILNEELVRTQKSYADAESIANARLEENARLSKQLRETEQALVEAQAVAETNLSEATALIEQLKQTEQAQLVAESIASSRLAENARLSKQLSETERALVEAQTLAEKNLSDASFLMKQLRQTQQAQSKAEFLAMARLEEISHLSEKLVETDKALMQAQYVSERNLNEMSALMEQLKLMEQAKSSAEGIALARLDENKSLVDRLQITDSALLSAQELVYSRTIELEKLSDQINLLESIASEKETELERLDNKNRQAEEYISSIERSKIWRVVKFLRLFKGNWKC